MSQRRSIVVEEINCRRSVAADLEGRAVGELSPGINVIYGPNGSGKSTLARLLQTMLWPEEIRRKEASFVGRLRLDELIWRVDYDGGNSVRRLDDGATVEAPAVPPATSRDRYLLCLRELLSGDGASFAEFILRESVGGYDVEAAAEKLAFSMPTLRRQPATKEVERARREWEKAQRNQRELRRRAKELDRWRRRLEKADESAQRADAVELAIEVLEHQNQLRRLEARLDSYPETIGAIRGDEVEVLESLRAEIDEAEQQIRHGSNEVDNLEQKLAGNRLTRKFEGERPSGEDLPWRLDLAEPPDVHLKILDGHLQRWEELERKLTELRRSLADRRRRRKRLWRRIGGGFDEVEVPELDADAVDEVLGLARRFEENAAKEAAHRELEALVDDASETSELEEIRRGVALLRSWLSTPSASDSGDDLHGPRRAILAMSVLLAIVAVVTAVLVHPGGLGLLLFVALSGWLFWVLGGVAGADGEEASRRRVYRRDFENTSLQAPATWSGGDVQKRLVELIEEWARGQLASEKARWWRQRNEHGRGAELAELSKRLQEERRRIEKQYGIDAGDGAGAFVLAENIHRWQLAGDDEEGLCAECESLQAQRDELRHEFGQLLKPIGVNSVQKLAEAKAHRATFDTEVQSYEQTTERFAGAREKLREAGETIDEAEDRRRALFERLGVQGVVEVRQLCDKREDYHRLREEVLVARRHHANKIADLEGMPAFDDELLSQTPERLEAQLDELRSTGDGRDEILKKIQQIQTTVETAKTSVEAEQKWAEYHRKRDKLTDRRHRDLHCALGTVLARWVGGQSRDRSRPQVFHRGRRIFARITRGRYRLELVDSGTQPRFVAFDETQQREFALGELSSGTRVQLLLALRVAFVEGLEPGAKLPLILDEALANSDDMRARAIVEAVEEIAAEGRQIFYFTAQLDEVRTWRELIGDSDVDGKIIDLGALSRAAKDDGRRAGLGEEVRPPKRRPVPEPGAMSHDEYGAVLDVDGAVDPWSPVENIHLWMVVEDVDRLQHLLGDGVRRCGELRNLARHGGGKALGFSKAEYAAVEARICALEALLEARAIGRGRPVDRRVLEESGAVSDTFIERVDELRDDVDGDTERLLEALEDGEVKRFRQSKIEELRRYFENYGHFDDRQPLGPQALWVRVNAAVADERSRGDIDEQGLRRLLRRARGSEGAKKQGQQV